MVDTCSDELLKPIEVAERLGISTSSAHRLMRSSTFEIVDITPEGNTRRTLRVRSAVLDAWLSSRTA